jgi:hypothetical protein
MGLTKSIFISLCAMFLAASAAWSQNPTFIRGDVNSDGVVSESDKTMLFNYLFIGGGLTCILAGDVNDDGSVPNLTDYTYLTNFVNGGAAPPAPYPGCGIDPTNPQPGADCCEAQVYLCGNANGDGSINVGDVVFVINHVFKSGPEPDPRCLGYVNTDDLLNVADAVYLINRIFKSGPPPRQDCCP